jgi:hypothetical protein
VTCDEFSYHYHAYFVQQHCEWVVVRPGTEKCYQLLDMYALETTPSHVAIQLKHSVTHEE